MRITTAPSELLMSKPERLISTNQTYESEKVQVYWLGFFRMSVVLYRYSRQLSKQHLHLSSIASESKPDVCKIA